MVDRTGHRIWLAALASSALTSGQAERRFRESLGRAGRDAARNETTTADASSQSKCGQTRENTPELVNRSCANAARDEKCARNDARTAKPGAGHGDMLSGLLPGRRLTRPGWLQDPVSNSRCADIAALCARLAAKIVADDARSQSATLSLPDFPAGGVLLRITRRRDGWSLSALDGSPQAAAAMQAALPELRREFTRRGLGGVEWVEQAPAAD